MVEGLPLPLEKDKPILKCLMLQNLGGVGNYILVRSVSMEAEEIAAHLPAQKLITGPTKIKPMTFIYSKELRGGRPQLSRMVLPVSKRVVY